MFGCHCYCYYVCGSFAVSHCPKKLFSLLVFWYIVCIYCLLKCSMSSNWFRVLAASGVPRKSSKEDNYRNAVSGSIVFISEGFRWKMFFKLTTGGEGGELIGTVFRDATASSSITFFLTQLHCIWVRLPYDLCSLICLCIDKRLKTARLIKICSSTGHCGPGHFDKNVLSDFHIHVARRFNLKVVML